MTLSSLVVSRDWQEISVLECILGGLRIEVDVEPEPERARSKLAKSKIDALIVDCDLNGAAKFLARLESENLQHSVPLVIISRSGGRNALQAKAASFVFQKPISVEQAVHTLSAARNMILDGRLRYHREKLDLRVRLTCPSRRRFHAHLTNLSRGGMRVHFEKPVLPAGPLAISFLLPGTRRSMTMRGELAWMDERGNAGLRFLEIRPRAQRDLQLWLERQYFSR
jgi:PilZ domain-containing protein